MSLDPTRKAPQAPEWAIERAEKISTKIEDIGPGPLRVKFIAEHLVVAHTEGRIYQQFRKDKPK